MSLQSCPPSADNTMLAICYTCEALCYSAHRCCAVECSVACCAAQHTAIATLTVGTVGTYPNFEESSLTQVSDQGVGSTIGASGGGSREA